MSISSFQTPREIRIRERDEQAAEFANSFSKEFFLKFGIVPSVFYTFKKMRYKVNLEGIVNTVEDVLKDDPEYVPGHSIKSKLRKRYLVLHRQCAFRVALQAGYGPSIIGSAFNHNHATVIHGNKIIQQLLDSRDRQTAYILRTIENELEKRYGTEGDVQPHNGSGIDTQPVLHAL